MSSTSHADGTATGHTAGTDVVVRLPLLRGVTYNEAHSALLGLVGVFVGIGFHVGYRKEAAGFTLLAVCAAFGCRWLSGEDVPVARRVLRREPWYFLSVFVVTAVGAGLSYPLL